METHHTHTPVKKKSRCIICNRHLKVFETKLCSCLINVCMKHRNKLDHNCSEGLEYMSLDKITSLKINKI